jgi:hypothetical protein
MDRCDSIRVRGGAQLVTFTAMSGSPASFIGTDEDSNITYGATLGLGAPALVHPSINHLPFPPRLFLVANFRTNTVVPLTRTDRAVVAATRSAHRLETRAGSSIKITETSMSRFLCRCVRSSVPDRASNRTNQAATRFWESAPACIAEPPAENAFST